jgi:hypothetical protein
MEPLPILLGPAITTCIPSASWIEIWQRLESLARLYQSALAFDPVS